MIRRTEDGEQQRVSESEARREEKKMLSLSLFHPNDQDNLRVPATFTFSMKGFLHAGCSVGLFLLLRSPLAIAFHAEGKRKIVRRVQKPQSQVLWAISEGRKRECRRYIRTSHLSATSQQVS